MAESGWISVKERMPETDDAVLSINNFKAQQIAAYGDIGNGPEWVYYSGSIAKSNAKWPRLTPTEITHWQPLPAPPQE